MCAATPVPRVRRRTLGRADYRATCAAMAAFTAQRDATTPDELWQVEHPPVYTLGLNGKAEHIHAPLAAPLERTDRGGQATYHGPGQLVLYTLIDLRRLSLGVKPFVTLLEQAVIDVLAAYAVYADRRSGAPGIYVEGAKIGAIGLRIKHGCSYHGISLNVAMDLSAFSRINPCGEAGLRVTQTADLGIDATMDDLGDQVADRLIALLYPSK